MKQKQCNEKIRKVFLENLVYGGKLISDKNINWTDSCLLHSIVKFEYDDIKGEIELLGYDKKKQKLKIKYNNDYFEILSGNLIQCNLGRVLKVITVEFKIEIGTTIKDKNRNIVIVEREYRNKKKKTGSVVKEKWYKYTCNVCGWTEGWMEESNLKTKGCSCCRGLTVVEGINDIVTTDPWMIPYVGEEISKTHTCNSHKKIRPICPSCNKQANHIVSIYCLYKNKTISCDCKDNVSYPNKFLHNFLKQLDDIYNFEYLEFEYSPKWVGKKSYDSYFIYNNKKYIIEMDGSLGHGKRMHSKSNKSSKESLEIDREKDNLAIDNGIKKPIRIDCDYEDMGKRFQYIKNNILNNNKINELFDMNLIDFQKCNDYAISNLVRIISLIKRKNPDMTCPEIAKETGYSSNAIVGWLKIGNSLGLCHYNPVEESSKSSYKNGKNNAKSIVCIEISRVFNSIHECVENSITIFGILLNKTGISEVCSGKRSHHKGYHFKYTKNLTDEEKQKYNIK